MGRCCGNQPEAFKFKPFLARCSPGWMGGGPTEEYSMAAFGVVDSEQSLGTEQLFPSAARKQGRAKGRGTGMPHPTVTAGD